MASLLSLPCELRQHIFGYVLLANHGEPPNLDRFGKHTDARIDLHSVSRSTSRYRAPEITMMLRNIDPHHYRTFATLTWPKYRSTYNLGGSGHGYAPKYTTYECVTRELIAKDISVMLVSRQVHHEAARVLYGGVTFDFDTHFQAIEPFLSDLTPYTRSCVKSLRLIKSEQGMTFSGWDTALSYLANRRNGVLLQALQLGFIVGPAIEETRLTGAGIALEYGDLPMGPLSWLPILLRLPRMQDVRTFRVVGQHDYTSDTHNPLCLAFNASIDTTLIEYLHSRLLIA